MGNGEWEDTARSAALGRLRPNSKFNIQHSKLFSISNHEGAARMLGSIRVSRVGGSVPAAANFLVGKESSAGTPKTARGTRALPPSVRGGA